MAQQVRIKTSVIVLKPLALYEHLISNKETVVLQTVTTTLSTFLHAITNMVDDRKTLETYKSDFAMLMIINLMRSDQFVQGTSYHDYQQICVWISYLVDVCWCWKISICCREVLSSSSFELKLWVSCRGKQIISDIASGLYTLHELRIAHLDLKSANILLEQGNGKIADFGLGKMVNSTATATATHPGTVAWAAPEVLEGKYSLKSDLWSFSTILIEVRTILHPEFKKSCIFLNLEIQQVSTQIIAKIL